MASIRLLLFLISYWIVCQTQNCNETGCAKNSRCIDNICIDSNTTHKLTVDLLTNNKEEDESIFTTVSDTASKINVICILLGLCVICCICVIISCYDNIFNDNAKNEQIRNTISGESKTLDAIFSDTSEDYIDSPMEYKIEIVE
eukprot:798197_1